MATKKKPVINHAAGAVTLKVLAARDEVEGVARGVTTFKVDPRIIVIDWSKNVRPKNVAHIANLKQARLDGAIFPAFVVGVEDGVIEIIDGYHRLTEIVEAIEAGAEIDSVQCVEFKGPASERRAMKVGAGLGLGLTPLQVGEQYKLLNTADGWSIAKIAARFGGKSEQHVRDMIQLSEVETDVKTQIEAGTVSASAALKVVKKEGKGAGKVIKAAVEDAQAKGKTKATPKALAKGITAKHVGVAADKFVKEAADRAVAAKTHLSAMLDSPAIDATTKTAVKTVLVRLGGKLDIPQGSGMKYETGMFWLQELAGDQNTPANLAEGCRWLLARMRTHDDNPNEALPDDTTSMHEAADIEQKSGGQVRAENLCPQHASLIAYLRGTGAA